MSWLEVSIAVPQEAAEAVSEVLSRYAPQGVAVDMGDGDLLPDTPVTVKAYLPEDVDIDMRRHQVEQALWHLHHIWSVIPEPVFTAIADQDWTAGWKESIPILHLGRHVVIKPSWREYAHHEGDVVLEMDPGLAFGTGLHPTTQLCIAALEDYIRPGMRVLDLGTGTGILALIAAKLGAAEVLAVDTDVNAVTATRRNARVNDVVHLIRLVHGSLADVGGTYHLVVANILAPVIISMAQEGLATRIRADGLLMVSGILADQIAEVQAALTQAGLRVVAQSQQGEWVVLIAKRVEAVPSNETHLRC